MTAVSTMQMETKDVSALVLREASAINSALKDFRIRAKVATAADVTVCGSAFVRYRLTLDPGVAIADVRQRLPDLAAAVYRTRGRKAGVRFDEPDALEVEHPAPQPLNWRAARLQLKPGRMLIGRDYSVSPAADSVVDLDDPSQAHVLVAGQTGSGKSTLAKSLLATLTLNTGPEHLQLYLIDLKGEDLVMFRRLPHVARVAIREKDASEVIAEVHEILEQRVTMGKVYDAPRILLAIDEYAELDADDIPAIDSILRRGRSKRVHVLTCIQKPTVAALGQGRGQYGVRLVGKVGDKKESDLACGRGGLGAETLPGKGAFFRIDGDVHRVQAYHFDDAVLTSLVDAAVKRWGRNSRPVAAPVEPVASQQLQPVETVENGLLQQAVVPVVGAAGAILAENWPIRGATVAAQQVKLPFDRKRPPNEEEAEFIRQKYAETRSIAQTVRVCYGSYDGKTQGYVSGVVKGGAA